MFIIIPIALLLITFIFTLQYKLNNKRFDALLKGIDNFKSKGNLSDLSKEEQNDIVLITGKQINQLWKNK